MVGGRGGGVGLVGGGRRLLNACLHGVGGGLRWSCVALSNAGSVRVQGGLPEPERWNGLLGVLQVGGLCEWLAAYYCVHSTVSA